jgi:hypothetical protein
LSTEADTGSGIFSSFGSEGIWSTGLKNDTEAKHRVGAKSIAGMETAFQKF